MELPGLSAYMPIRRYQQLIAPLASSAAGLARAHKLPHLCFLTTLSSCDLLSPVKSQVQRLLISQLSNLS